MLSQSEIGAFVAFETEIKEVLLGGETEGTGKDWKVRMGALGEAGSTGRDWDGLEIETG